MSTKIEELTKTKEEAHSRMLKARAEWGEAETFVDMALHDGFELLELLKAKAVAYDARWEYDQAEEKYLRASEAEEQERWNLYYLEELAAGRVQPDPPAPQAVIDEFPF